MRQPSEVNHTRRFSSWSWTTLRLQAMVIISRPRVIIYSFTSIRRCLSFRNQVHWKWRGLTWSQLLFDDTKSIEFRPTRWYACVPLGRSNNDEFVIRSPAFTSISIIWKTVLHCIVKPRGILKGSFWMNVDPSWARTLMYKMTTEYIKISDTRVFVGRCRRMRRFPLDGTMYTPFIFFVSRSTCKFIALRGQEQYW